jgi:hypothetical protein
MITQQFTLGFGITPWLGQQHHDHLSHSLGHFTPLLASQPFNFLVGNMAALHQLLLAGKDPGGPNTHPQQHKTRPE